VVGNYASPYTPGSAYVLLHHLFGEAAGVPGAWGHAIGGMGAITQAMAKAAARKGVEIVLDAPVEEIIVERAGRRAWWRAASAYRARGGGGERQPEAAVRRLLPEGAVAPEIERRWPAGRAKARPSG
jgi:phytoene dehydrogenase-like protein